jgi:hypothetical protein
MADVRKMRMSRQRDARNMSEAVEETPTVRLASKEEERLFLI